MDGFVIVDKDEGKTSFGACASLRKIYNEKKVGHTGTLDPLATGVLPVALGKASRFIPFLPDARKAYTAKFRLGISTDTLDITGKVLSERKAETDFSRIKSVAQTFLGVSMQLPPMYSALSQNGVRLYELARKGIEVEREKREIHIFDLQISDAVDGEYTICVQCSKGTYIRSLIADIGDKLGCGAVMTALRRTSTDGFDISQANTLEAIVGLREKVLLPLDTPFSGLPSVNVSQAQSVRFSNGGELMSQRLQCPIYPSLFRVYSNEDIFLGLGEISSEDLSTLKAKRVVGK